MQQQIRDNEEEAGQAKKGSVCYIIVVLVIVVMLSCVYLCV